jgi:type 1 glutamine amidotransferase/glyoxylase-like metal-dependent hydrolase (beta-lactamase superfamily II)
MKMSGSLSIVALGLANAVTIQSAAPAATPEQVAPGVFVLGSASRLGSANIGWVILGDQVILVGAPHPELVTQALAAVGKLTAKPVRIAIVTEAEREAQSAVPILARNRIAIVAPSAIARQLRSQAPEGATFREFSDRLVLREGGQEIEVLTPAHAATSGDTVVFLPKSGVLFACGFCLNGPRAVLEGRNTADWILGLREIGKIPARHVVPGYGAVGDRAILERQERYLRELRRQVGHLAAQGKSLNDVAATVQIAPEFLVWMPYDQPTRPEMEHVYGELTVPKAPFAVRPFASADSRPKALALVGDRPHDPAHIEESLARAFESAGIDARIAVDVRCLSAENLKAVQLFVILRDGANWPNSGDGRPLIWMTPEQERAIVDFVEAGGGLLVLHNATALYPEHGPYLDLVGGRYTGHGPLERFRVNVVDRAHPITRGVADFEVADEQHTPVPDRSKVELLLENRSDGGIVAAAGWAYRRGRGRVAYLANGHTRDAHAHPEFRKLLRNAMRWCISMEID